MSSSVSLNGNSSIEEVCSALKTEKEGEKFPYQHLGEVLERSISITSTGDKILKVGGLEFRTLDDLLQEPTLPHHLPEIRGWGDSSNNKLHDFLVSKDFTPSWGKIEPRTVVPRGDVKYPIGDKVPPVTPDMSVVDFCSAIKEAKHPYAELGRVMQRSLSDTSTGDKVLKVGGLEFKILGDLLQEPTLPQHLPEIRGWGNTSTIHLHDFLSDPKINLSPAWQRPEKQIER